MVRSSFYTGLFFILFFASCKENKKSDPVLEEAFSIQDEAIHIGMKVDSLIESRLAEGAFRHDVGQLRKWKSSLNLWKNSMVIIPGEIGKEQNHVHDPHDHAHHDHDHAHGENEVASHLSPAELKQVQLEWKAAIMAIRDSLR